VSTRPPLAACLLLRTCAAQWPCIPSRSPCTVTASVSCFRARAGAPPTRMDKCLCISRTLEQRARGGSWTPCTLSVCRAPGGAAALDVRSPRPCHWMRRCCSHRRMLVLQTGDDRGDDGWGRTPTGWSSWMRRYQPQRCFGRADPTRWICSSLAVGSDRRPEGRRPSAAVWPPVGSPPPLAPEARAGPARGGELVCACLLGDARRPVVGVGPVRPGMAWGGPVRGGVLAATLIPATGGVPAAETAVDSRRPLFAVGLLSLSAHCSPGSGRSDGRVCGKASAPPSMPTALDRGRGRREAQSGLRSANGVDICLQGPPTKSAPSVPCKACRLEPCAGFFTDRHSVDIRLYAFAGWPLVTLTWASAQSSTPPAPGGSELHGRTQFGRWSKSPARPLLQVRDRPRSPISRRPPSI